MITGGPRTLSDGVVTLREVRREDGEDLYRWRMDPASRFMFHSTELVPYERHLHFLQSYFAPGNTDAWFIIEAEGAAIGTISLYDISDDGSQAEWGRFVIAPEHRRRGFGRRALALLLDHARQAGVRRLGCDVLGSNDHVRRVYRRMGFVETGAIMVGGREFVTMTAAFDDD